MEEQVKTENLKNKSIFATMWKFLERFAAKAVSLIVTIVLARLLTPDDYSVVGIVSIFFVFANIFISGGFNTALIQKKQVDIIDYSSVLFLNMFIASIMYAIIFFAAPVIAKLYNQEILIPVFRIMGLTLFINAFKSILCAHVSRSLQFKKFFLATIGGTIVSAIVGIAMAMKGFGPWALVAQQMINSFIDTVILFFTTKFRVVLKISFKKLGILFKYGWKIFVASIISTIYDEVNPLVIGLKYSGADLSFYTKGRSFPHLINSTLGDTFSAVLFPVMSKVQDDKAALLQCTRRFMKVSSFVIFPAMVGFAMVADNFISVLLTDKWAPASIYIQIFCMVFMLNIIQKGNLEVIRASGRSDLLLLMEIIKKSLYFVVIVLFLIFTNTPQMLAVACFINTLIATVVNTFPNRSIIGYSYRNQIADLLPNFISAILMGIVVYFIGLINMNKGLLLVCQILIGAIFYILINIITKNKTLKYYIDTVKSLLRRKTNEAK